MVLDGIDKLYGIKSYGGYILGDSLLKVSSGGVASVLSQIVIDRGGVVFGVRYTDDYYGAEYMVVEHQDQLCQIRGSKYCQTNKMIMDESTSITIYDCVGKYLELNREVLFIGVGCDIGALRAFCKKHSINCEKLFCVELLCHGTTFKDVQKKFVLELENRYKSRVIDFSVRYKNGSWTPLYVYAKFENEKKYLRPLYCTDYGIAFERYATPQCYSCKFKGENHKGDIVIGDYWGLKKGAKEWNKNGVSAIMVLSDKGNSLVSALEENEQFHIFEGNTKLILDNNLPYYQCRKKTTDYDVFKKNISNNTLEYSVKRIDCDFKCKMKLEIKRSVPSSLYRIFFNIFKH